MDETDDPRAKKICRHCVGDDYLREEIRAKGKRLKCSYCGRIAASYRIGDLAGRIGHAFTEHYVRTPDLPYAWEMALYEDAALEGWERQGDPVVHAIMNAARIPEQAASDVQEILGEDHWDLDAAAMGDETEFARESHYQQKSSASDESWQDEWRRFERTLKTEARFFSRSAASHLATIFDGIDTMKTRDGRPLVADAGPGTPLTGLYRARVFQSAPALEAALERPDRDLGSPPPSFASAGRMNAHGISVFYGADGPEVALAEVRPPVGSHVTVARFDILRPLRLLDLTALGAVSTSGSIFDPNLAGRLERATFLRSLAQRLARPVMPNDEAFDYLTTQAVADFLATGITAPIDGIIFPSVQAGAGLNVALFHKAARVQEMEIPAGTEITVNNMEIDGYDWYTDYSVIEEVPRQKEEVPDEYVPPEDPETLALIERLESLERDQREATLKIADDAVTVHMVKAVRFDTDEYPVRRHRREKLEQGRIDF